MLFREASFSLEAGEKVCLIGRNGSGKSTFFRLIMGEIEPDEGDILLQQDINFGRLEQALPEELGLSVKEFVSKGLEKQESLINQYKEETKKSNS